MDLREWLTPDRGKALLDLIDECPTACRWREAYFQDDAAAWERVEAEENGLIERAEAQKWRPRLSEYDLDAELLSQIRDVLGGIATSLGSRYKPPAGPQNAYDDARERFLRAEFDELNARVTRNHKPPRR